MTGTAVSTIGTEESMTGAALSKIGTEESMIGTVWSMMLTVLIRIGTGLSTMGTIFYGGKGRGRGKAGRADLGKSISKIGSRRVC
jgi:hypothetical protein